MKITLKKLWLFFRCTGRFLLLTLLIALGVHLYWNQQLKYPSTSDATLQAPVIPIVSQVSGTIYKIKVKPGQYVKKNQVLFTLNDRQQKIALRKAILTFDAEKIHNTMHENQINLAQNKVEQAKLNLSYTKITAPTSGFLTFFHLHTGQHIFAQKALFAQSDASNFYIQANILEYFLKRIHVGQPVLIKLKMYPHTAYHGVVEGIGYAVANTNSSASLAPTVNPSFNWIQLAKRFPIYIKITSPHHFNKHPFFIGASAWIRIDTTKLTK